MTHQSSRNWVEYFHEWNITTIICGQDGFFWRNIQPETFFYDYVILLSVLVNGLKYKKIDQFLFIFKREIPVNIYVRVLNGNMFLIRNVSCKCGKSYENFNEAKHVKLYVYTYIYTFEDELLFHDRIKF